jgi:hypothetical protein
MTLLNKLASPFQDDDKAPIIGVVEPITIQKPDGTLEEGVLAKVDSGEDYSQVDKKLAQELGLYSTEQIVDRVPATIDGKEKLVDQIEVTFSLDGEQYQSRWLVVDREDEKQRVVLGKNDLRGYLIKIPQISE